MGKSPLLFLGLVLILLGCKNSQLNKPNERLYNKVDLIITDELNYEYKYDADEESEPSTTDKQKSRFFHPTSSSNTEPFILVDGVPTEKVDLKNISIKEVKEISVLEGASGASAIYGARAFNGVILITTKNFKRNEKSDH